MKKALVILSVLTSVAHAGQVSHLEKWHTVQSKNMTIQFQAVDNPRKVCEQQSKAYGNSGFAYTVDACAFWWPDGRCHIIAGKRVDLDALGHELLHCIKGDWHAQNFKKP